MPTRNIKLTKTNIGGDSGPFSIYRNSVQAGNLIAANIARSTLESGYTIYNEDVTVSTYIAVSTGICTNSASVSIPSPTLILSTTDIYLDGGFDSTTFTITSTDQTWTVSSNQSWCTVAPIYGSGNGTITVEVSENPSEINIRQAQITVTGSITGPQYITVTQDVGVYI